MQRHQQQRRPLTQRSGRWRRCPGTRRQLQPQSGANRPQPPLLRPALGEKVAFLRAATADICRRSFARDPSDKASYCPGAACHAAHADAKHASNDADQLPAERGVSAWLTC